MAMLSIQGPRGSKDKKRDVWDQIALGIQMANSIVGMGTSVYGAVEKGQQAEREETKLGIEATEKVRPATQQEVEAGKGMDISGLVGKHVPREQARKNMTGAQRFDAKIQDLKDQGLEMIVDPEDGIVKEVAKGDVPEGVGTIDDYEDFQIAKGSEKTKSSQRVRKENYEQKLSKERRSTLSKAQSTYNSNVKNLADAVRYAKQGLSIINANGPASEMIGAVQFAAARAAGSNSQLSDKEREALAGKVDLLSKFKQLISTQAQSQFIDANKAAFRDLFTVYMDSADEIEHEIATRYATQLKANPLFGKEKIERLLSDITGGRIKSMVREEKRAEKEKPAPPKRDAINFFRSPGGR